MEIEKLYTSKEIAELYRTSAYNITHNWTNRGLKHIYGKNGGFLFKTVWVDEFIEKMAEENVEKKSSKENFEVATRKKRTKKSSNLSSLRVV